MSTVAALAADASTLSTSVAATVTSTAGTPLLAVAIVSTTGLVMRAALLELRWWLALRGTAPRDRSEIIRALGPTRARPRARGRP